MAPPTEGPRILGYIAANVRRTRTRRNMTQEKLAEAAGLSSVHVQRVERAEVNMSVTVLAALAEALKVSPATLFKAAKFTPAATGRPKKRRGKRT